MTKKYPHKTIAIEERGDNEIRVVVTTVFDDKHSEGTVLRLTWKEFYTLFEVSREFLLR